MILEKNELTEVENTTEQEARAAAILAEEHFKEDYNFYIVNFGGAFGVSMLIYADSRLILQDFQLHHRHHIGSDDDLIKYYIDKADKVIFSQKELNSPIANYGDYQNRIDFLVNHYAKRRENVSSIFIGDFPAERRMKLDTTFKYFSAANWAYYEDSDFVSKFQSLYRRTKKLYKAFISTDEGFRNAIRYELANHEACITCDYANALDSLGYDFDKLPALRQKIVLEELKKQVRGYEVEL